jgi:hypothetical protein
MQKVLLSIVVATVALPLLAARGRRARRGLFRMLLLLLAFDVAYVAWVTLVHAEYVTPPRRGGDAGAGP